MIYYLTKQLSTENNFSSITVEEIIDYIRTKKIIGVDTETSGLSFLDKRIIMLQFGDKDNQFVIDARYIDITVFKDILEDGIERPILSEKLILSFKSGKSDFKNRFKIKNLKKDFIANCLDTKNPRGRRTQTFFYYNNEVSYCTPRECFRLQDFPDSFKFVVSNSQLYKQAGNSISVNMIEMIFTQIELARHTSTKKDTLF
jgi:site-specific DNA-cytosine methylase